MGFPTVALLSLTSCLVRLLAFGTQPERLQNPGLSPPLRLPQTRHYMFPLARKGQIWVLSECHLPPLERENHDDKPTGKLAQFSQMTHATCHIPAPLWARRETIHAQEKMEPKDQQKGVVSFVDVCCAPQY